MSKFAHFPLPESVTKSYHAFCEVAHYLSFYFYFLSTKMLRKSQDARIGIFFFINFLWQHNTRKTIATFWFQVDPMVVLTCLLFWNVTVVTMILSMPNDLLIGPPTTTLAYPVDVVNDRWPEVLHPTNGWSHKFSIVDHGNCFFSPTTLLTVMYALSRPSYRSK